MAFSLSTTIKLYDTDASGYIFYGSLCRLTQECFEAFLRDRNLPIERWISGDLPPLPVRKFESEYLAPVRVGHAVQIELSSVELGTSSLVASFSIVNVTTGTKCARARVTHVAVDRDSGTPIALPRVASSLEIRG
jgi:acyl-CoA thioesterase FadM